MINGTMYVYHGSSCGGAAVGELSFKGTSSMDYRIDLPTVWQ